MKRSNYPFLNPAINAARKAGEYLLRNEGKVSTIIDKNYLDFYNPATDIDVEAEKIILDIITASYPNHNFLCEESGEIQNDPSSPYMWIIDPLDGTSNYRYSVPFYSVSVGLYNKDTKNMEIGVVYAPQLNRLYSAVRGVGVECNNGRIRVNTPKSIERAMIIGSFKKYSSRINTLQRVLEEKQAHFTCFKACSLEMCFVAEGKGDIFVIPARGINTWDVAAGSLIMHEAGGCTLNMQGQEFDLFSKNKLICGSRNAVNLLLQELND